MSRRELRRVEVLARVQAEELKLIDAASLMGVSYRQAKRIGKRYREEGAEGMKHRSAGRRSSRAKPEKFRGEVLGLVRRKYSGEEGRRFGPTLAAEHLSAEDGLAIDAETLRRWMLAEGLWSRERKRQQHRARREPKPHVGELVQLGKEETIWAAVRTLRAWIERYGVPQAIYVDWKNLYKRAPTSRELLRGEEPVTQFGRMCAKLGIRIIAASSAQAKGRVERTHGTHQDRLVKKLRLAGVPDY